MRYRFLRKIFLRFLITFLIILSFADIGFANNSLKWYIQDYNRLISYGIIEPSKPLNFDANISAGEFSLILERLLKFTPIKSDGVLLKDDRTLSRLEVIRFVIDKLKIKSDNKYIKKNYLDIKNYSDNGLYVKTAIETKIITGFPGEKFNLFKKVTVAETMVILNRVLQLYDPEQNIVKVKVKGLSMEPTLLNGSSYFFNKQAYRLNKAERGDIVLYKSHNAKELYIKRIVALGNESVEIKNNKLYVNGQLFEKYAKVKFENSINKKIVPPGCVFVIGDNVNFSIDSRNPEVGNIASKNIIGKIVLLDEDTKL